MKGKGIMKSVLNKDQSKNFTKEYTENGTKYRITAKVRYDDRCGNGHNTFSITGDIDEYCGNRFREYSGGCIHDDIKKHFPELAHLIKWHLVSSDGPMHYIPNTVYHASNRDHNGLLKGEKRQIKNGKSGLPVWNLVAVNKITGEEVSTYKLPTFLDSVSAPDCDYALEYRPAFTVGEGKERQFDLARSSAVWPEATDAELSVSPEQLTEKLIARLPTLLKDFRKDIESLGFNF